MTSKEKTIHEQGLVSVLKQIHDDLDAAVFEAYGWPATLTDDEILERLVALNAERAEEERRGIIRWLRPEFQNPTGDAAQQKSLDMPSDEADETEDDGPGKVGRKRTSTKKKPAAKAEPAAKGKSPAKLQWPKGREAQAKAVLTALRDADASQTPEELTKRFARAPAETVEELLEALATLGQARRLRGGRYKG